MKPQFSRKKIIQTSGSEVSTLEPQLWAALPSQERPIWSVSSLTHGNQKMEWHGVPRSGLINGENWTYNAYKWSYKLFHPTDFAPINLRLQILHKIEVSFFSLLKSKIPSLLGNSWKAIVEQMVEHSICGTPEIWGNLRVSKLDFALAAHGHCFLKWGGWRKKNNSPSWFRKMRCLLPQKMLLPKCDVVLPLLVIHEGRCIAYCSEGPETQESWARWKGNEKTCFHPFWENQRSSKCMAIFRDFP